MTAEQASGSMISILPPKAPPSGALRTRTCSVGRPNSLASESRVENGAWVELRTTSSPSGSSHAVAVWVSRYPWYIQGVSKRPRTTDVARGQRGVDVAVGQPGGAQDVVGELLALQSGGRHGGVGVGDVRSLVHVRLDHPRPRRARPGGGLEVHHRLERLELHVDERGAVLGLGLGLGDDHRHRLAGVDHLVACERLIEPALARGDDRQVAGGEHRDDARARPTPPSASMAEIMAWASWARTSRAWSSPGTGRVSGELRRPPDLGLGITAGGGDADRGHIAQPSTAPPPAGPAFI